MVSRSFQFLVRGDKVTLQQNFPFFQLQPLPRVWKLVKLPWPFLNSSVCCPFVSFSCDFPEPEKQLWLFKCWLHTVTILVLCSLLTSSKDCCRLKSIRNYYCWECFPLKPKRQSLAESLLNKVQHAETLGLAGTKHGGDQHVDSGRGFFPFEVLVYTGLSSAMKSQFESLKSIQGQNSGVYMRGSVVRLCVSVKNDREANREHRFWCMWVIVGDLETRDELRSGDVCRMLHSALIFFIPAVRTAFPKRDHNTIWSF